MSAAYELYVFWGEELRRFPLEAGKEVRIGRAEGNDVRIDDPSVSRKHALLMVDHNLVIRDLGGANGTLIRESSRPSRHGETEPVKQLRSADAAIKVGEPVTVGVATLVVKRGATDTPLATDEGGLIIRDKVMRELYEQAGRAAGAPISVLILGETGVGKEVLAKAIHARSPRAKGRFVSFNCGALADSIIESELFGNEKGAFTGAVLARPGLFEAASGGTVFMDEVGELSPSAQAKLLRVLEDKKVTRVGGRSERTIDVRFVSATNRDLQAAATDGHFRQDLYFRLNGISLLIPPLRERTSEIEPLSRAFVAAACRALDRGTAIGIDGEALQLLIRYPWPGNVRELRNVIDRAVVLSSGNIIRAEHLSPEVREPATRSSNPASDPREALEAQIKNMERSRIIEALEQCGGNQTRAAEVLGVSRRTLVSRLKDLDVPRPRASRKA